MGYKKQLLLIFLIFLVCELVKDFEFLVLKTDQTFLAENIICKLFVIAVLPAGLKRFHFTWGDLGFKKSGIAQGACLGIALGAVTFAVSYLIEYCILRGKGLHPEFSFYITDFAISEQNITGVSLQALLICLLGNFVNVFAEEGLSREL